MGRSPCCDKVGLKKGPWTAEEDQKLVAYIEEHGHGSWRALPGKAGLQRCGKSCRLRWTNYLRPDIKRGKFSLQEEQTIIQLHALLGNRWSAIAAHLPKRTDNEIKNYWNTHLKKRLAKMGLDPVTHKAKSDALGSSAGGGHKSAANLSHMAQWESARLEAEARLARESKLRSQAPPAFQSTPLSSSSSLLPQREALPPPPLPCLDVFKAWQWQCQGTWPRSSTSTGGLDLESPTSTLSYSENAAPPNAGAAVGSGENDPTPMIESGSTDETAAEGGEGGITDRRGYEDPSLSSSDRKTTAAAVHAFPSAIDDDSAVPSYFVEGFTELLLQDSDDDEQEDKNNNHCNKSEEMEEAEEGNYDEAKSYWNNILNLVNSPSGSPLF